MHPFFLHPSISSKRDAQRKSSSIIPPEYAPPLDPPASTILGITLLAAKHRHIGGYTLSDNRLDVKHCHKAFSHGGERI